MKREFVLTDERIFDILGIEPENRKGKRERTYLKQFRHLASKYNPDSIWLRGDYGTYAKGYVAQHETAEVETVVIEEPKEKPYDPKEELKRNRLRALSLNFKTQKGLEELERQPAYMRRDMNYEEIEAEEEVSQYSASSQGISSENSFLHKGVD